MAVISQKKERSTPAISTASLPDIIFMLLFFFMVTTTLKEVEYKVQIHLPQASEAKRLVNKSLVSYIYIGKPIKALQKMYGTKPVIQLNDQIATVNDIPKYVELERSKRPAGQAQKLVFSLKVDKDTKMGIVTDVKQALRKVQALKINYSTTKPAKKKP